MSGLPQVEGTREGTFSPAPRERPKLHLLPRHGVNTSEGAGEALPNTPKGWDRPHSHKQAFCSILFGIVIAWGAPSKVSLQKSAGAEEELIFSRPFPSSEWGDCLPASPVTMARVGRAPLRPPAPLGIKAGRKDFCFS